MILDQQVPQAPSIEPTLVPQPPEQPRTPSNSQLPFIIAGLIALLIMGIGMYISTSNKNDLPEIVTNNTSVETEQEITTSSPTPNPEIEMDSTTQTEFSIFVTKRDYDGEINTDVTNPLDISDIKLMGRIPDGCIAWKHIDSKLKQGNADYTISCKKNLAQSVVEISINPTITGGGFGGLDPNGAENGMEAVDAAGSYTQKEITLFGKKLLWKPWSTTKYADQEGFFLSGHLVDTNSDPLITFNQKEILLNAFLIDINSSGTISVDGKDMLTKLEATLESLQMK